LKEAQNINKSLSALGDVIQVGWMLYAGSFDFPYIPANELRTLKEVGHSWDAVQQLLPKLQFLNIIP
jgi:hypothetical protein